MYVCISIGYNELLIPIEEAAFLKHIEKARACKSIGYGSTKIYQIIDDAVELSFVPDNRVSITGDKIHSRIEELSKMTTRAWKAEEEKRKIQEELDALKLKFAPFIVTVKEETKKEEANESL